MSENPTPLENQRSEGMFIDLKRLQELEAKEKRLGSIELGIQPQLRLDSLCDRLEEISEQFEDYLESERGIDDLELLGDRIREGAELASAERVRIVRLLLDAGKERKSMLTKEIHWHESPHKNSRPNAFVKPDTIVIHDTGSTTAKSAISTCLGEREVSYHYIIGKDGELHQLVDESKRAWHAGKAHLHGEKTDVNGRSIGIGLVSMGSEEYPPEQIATLLELCADIMRRQPVSLRNIVGHRDVALPPGRKTDPGQKFPWDQLLVQQVLMKRGKETFQQGRLDSLHGAIRDSFKLIQDEYPAEAIPEEPGLLPAWVGRLITDKREINAELVETRFARLQDFKEAREAKEGEERFAEWLFPLCKEYLKNGTFEDLVLLVGAEDEKDRLLLQIFVEGGE